MHLALETHRLTLKPQAPRRAPLRMHFAAGARLFVPFGAAGQPSWTVVHRHLTSPHPSAPTRLQPPAHPTSSDTAAVICDNTAQQIRKHAIVPGLSERPSRFVRNGPLSALLTGAVILDDGEKPGDILFA